MKQNAAPTQLGLPLRPQSKWGGRRAGAGRKPSPSATRTSIQHRTRPFHDRHEPVLVTWKVIPGLPSLRWIRAARAVGTAIRTTTERHARRRTSFRIVHFSIQPDHLHLIVEAGSKTTLTRGLQGLAIAIARRVNRALERDGRLLAERYHARALRKPRDVRNALVYVLQNHRHHRPSRHLVDECSSGRWFTGWTEELPPPTTPCPVTDARTWLLRVGWRRHGLVDLDEGPRS